MSKIIISGSSWGMGEWGFTLTQSEWEKLYNNLKGANWPTCPNYKDYDQLPNWVKSELERAEYYGPDSIIHGGDRGITHLGLEQYLKDAGYDVINLSGIHSNKQTVDAIIKSIDIIKDEDTIIWIQSDPITDLRPYESFLKEFTSYNDIIQKQKALLITIYQRLNALNRRIICLGGSGKLDLELMSQYKNLIPCIPSITEFLLPKYIHPTVWFSDWYMLVDRQFDLDSLDKLVYNKKIQDSLFEKSSEFGSIYNQLFWPDGWHPNRVGHKLIFEYLISNENIS